MGTKMRAFRQWKAAEVILLATAALWLLSGAMAMETQAKLSERVVRLHVLANSDSEADQALKLQVRDRVLDFAGELLEDTTDRQGAERRLREALPEVQSLAEEAVRAAGYDYPVAVELEDTEFPTREYDTFALPAGEYLALRVLIGDAAGQNWWCVVFPPLCTAASADLAVTALGAGMEEDQVRLMAEEEGYVLKFKAVEWWQQLRQRLERT